MKVGDLVYDYSIFRPGMIIKKDIYWTDTDSVTYYWEFEVLYDDGRRAYAEKDELELLKEGFQPVDFPTKTKKN